MVLGGFDCSPQTIIFAIRPPRYLCSDNSGLTHLAEQPASLFCVLSVDMDRILWNFFSPTKHRIPTYRCCGLWCQNIRTLKNATELPSENGPQRRNPTGSLKKCTNSKFKPLLGSVTIASLALTLGVCDSYAADIRAGRHRPHPRHWLALAHLVETG